MVSAIQITAATKICRLLASGCSHVNGGDILFMKDLRNESIIEDHIILLIDLRDQQLSELNTLLLSK
jgi:hypothetical protein